MNKKYDKIYQQLLRLDHDVLKTPMTVDQMMDISDRLHWIQITLLNKEPK